MSMTLHTLILSRAFAKGAGSYHMHLSEGKASKGFIPDGSKRLERDYSAFLLSLSSKLDSGGLMADVQVVHLVVAIAS